MLVIVTVRSKIGLAIGLVVSAAAIVVLFVFDSPMRIAVSADVAQVDVRTLGEYPTTVQRIRLQSVDGVIWEVHGTDKTAQIGVFSLHSGVNATNLIRPDHGQYSVILPKDSMWFVLKPNVTYTLTVTGDIFPRSTRFRFTQ